ncbi:MAG: sensor histidine kinase [Hyphomicrobiales bacterium]|nr:HAMP domain-containing histidine kinase [Hyphomicrobiales bacterium]MDE2016781.1 sensor histidine kinase [Hyphomicrobiales bacterium]
MSARPRRAGSLRVNLVASLLAPLALLLAVGGWLSFVEARRQAGLLYDDQLAADARMIGEQLEWRDGDMRTATPPSSFALFPADPRDTVAFAVRGPSGRLIAGLGPLPPPRVAPGEFAVSAYDATFRGLPMRAVALTQPVLTPDGVKKATVLVGETLIARDALARSLWLRAFLSEAALVAIAALAAWIGVTRQLRPILRLRDAVRARRAADLSAFDAGAVQSELRPLVEALNGHMGRLGEVLARQRRFLDGAAHRLRTPLAVMKTQVGYALRGAEPAERDDVLAKLDGGLSALARLANQLLALARVEQDRIAPRARTLDAAAVARTAVADSAPRALDRGLSLAFETDGDCRVTAREALLREALDNLIDNAIAHAGAGASVEVSARREGAIVTLAVADDGHGAPGEDPERLMARFVRGRDAAPGGSGLGLAIVAEIASMSGGAARVVPAAAGHGFRVEIRMPASAGPA